MAFPHSLVTRTAWFVSAVVAVTLISKELRKDDRRSERTTRVTVARERAPKMAPARARVDTENIILSLTMLGDDEAKPVWVKNNKKAGDVIVAALLAFSPVS